MWKRVERVAQAAGSLIGSTVDRVGSNIRVWELTGSGQKSGSGLDRVRDDVSMTSTSGLTGSKTDRVRDWVGHAYWVKLTSANQLGFRSGACPSRAVVLNARGGA